MTGRVSGHTASIYMKTNRAGSADLLRARGVRKAGRGKNIRQRVRSPFPVRGVAVFLFILTAVLIGTFGLFARPGGSGIVEGVYVGPVYVGGMTIEEAREAIRTHVDGFSLTFTSPLGGASVLPPRGGQVRPLLSFETESALDQAFGIGRHSNILMAAASRLGASMFGKRIALPHSLDEELLDTLLHREMSDLIRPTREAGLRIVVDEDGNYHIEVVPERAGTEIDVDRLIRLARQRVETVSSEPIEVEISEHDPSIHVSDVEPLVSEAGPILERLPLDVSVQGESWTISRQTVASWLITSLQGDAGDDGVVLTLDWDKMRKYLESRGTSIHTEASDAVFRLEDGRVAEFIPSTEGRSLDLEASIELLTRLILEGSETGGEVAVLPITTVSPKTDTATSNPFGIREIIGVGETNFRGSPSNRRHNIAVGAATLNNILIPPGEEFSLIGALGEIDAAHGYLPELVIKETETIPEYGGGLCQIGSTAFRVALDSGLPITERRNHSYRVPYYERDGDGNYIGPGIDATIYDPAPDFKFINDTPAHILIRTAIDGNRLTFTFWGTDDGRTVEMSDVKVWNYQPPPETKYVKTTELPIGEEKCTESAHAGSNTAFTYTVTYADDEKKETEFVSYYRPWQAICMVGVDPSELEKEEAGEINPEMTDVDTAGVTGD